MCICVDRALSWNGDVRALPKCECLEECYVIITIMVMYVLWFYFSFTVYMSFEGWNKIMNPSISWARPWNPNMWILCCGSPTLWDIFLTVPIERCFISVLMEAVLSKFFVEGVEKTNLLTVFELSCLVVVMQVLIFPADSVGSVVFWMTLLFVHIISFCQQIRRLSVSELFPTALTHYCKVR